MPFFGYCPRNFSWVSRPDGARNLSLLRSKAAMTAAKSYPLCAVCNKPCVKLYERNTDGSWAHDDCLRGVQSRPSQK